MDKIPSPAQSELKKMLEHFLSLIQIVFLLTEFSWIFIFLAEGLGFKMAEGGDGLGQAWQGRQDR